MSPLLFFLNGPGKTILGKPIELKSKCQDNSQGSSADDTDAQGWLRPNNISGRHYAFLHSYFIDSVGRVDCELLDAYFTFPASVEEMLEKDDFAYLNADARTTLIGRIIEVAFGMPEVTWTADDSAAPARATLIWRINEVFLFAQIIVRGSWFFGLVVVSIIVAAATIGIQTYPSMANSPALSNINYVVQCTFSVDVGLKLISEGTRPYRFLYVRF